MKTVLNNLVINLASIACIVIAGLLAYQSKSNWEYFLIVGLLSQVLYEKN